ncbi:hypothetical protein CPB86DRAFT_399606 [Serendipita vermifera]|nr:hypothetical protein CPB86DRAFT_399606 [Serendipita vermifera]
MTSTHPFYIEILKHHRLNLQSLLMDPMTVQVHNQASPLWWINMPNLQVLATDFCDFSQIRPGRFNFLRTSRSDSVRHLIHFDHGALSSRMGFELCRYIPMCTRLEGITLVNDGVAVEWMTVRPVVGMTELRDLCIKRGIPIWSRSDVLKPRKIVTFVPR